LINRSQKIENAVLFGALKETPPELYADIVVKGIHLQVAVLYLEDLISVLQINRNFLQG